MTARKAEPGAHLGEGALPGHYEAIADHLRYWHQRLLPEWDVYLMAEAAADNELDERDPEAMAQTPTPYNALRVWISPALIARAEAGEEAWAYVEQVIVHEYLHGLVDRTYEAAEALERMVGAIAWQYFERSRALATERLVDALARALVAERRAATDAGEPRRGGLRPGNDWDADGDAG